MFERLLKKIFFSRGLSSQSIWLDALYSCSSSDRCLTSCQVCPAWENHNCFHSEDMTLECGTELIIKISVVLRDLGRDEGQCPGNQAYRCIWNGVLLVYVACMYH